jgi:WD40 repeat protein
MPELRADGLVLLAAACEDGSVRVHDADSCGSVYDVVEEDAKDAWQYAGNWRTRSIPTQTAFCRGAILLAVTCGGPQISLYRGLTGEHLMRLTAEQDAPVSALTWHGDAHTLAAGYDDGAVRLWSVPCILTTGEDD